MIKENVLRVREAVPAGVTIVAVSKGRSIEEIKEVIEAGITDIGENKVQEALKKFSSRLTGSPANPQTKLHMVGHLQSNKAKDAVKIFDLIHSVDSLPLASEIDRQASKINKIQNILIEIKTSPEATKFGFKPGEANTAIEKISTFKNLKIKGLMTIAPIVDDPEKTRPYFRILRELKDKINALQITPFALDILSMGMTDDFRIALEEGSNMLRLGRAIFAGTE